MAALWRNEGSGWELAAPTGFPDERTLHTLVEAQPGILPLAGAPRLVIVGSEVALGSGFADLVGMEPDGRPVVIEVKLRRNSEARRAVVAQALAYAAYLHGLSRDDLEHGVLASHLARRGHQTLAGAVAEDDQAGEFDPAAFHEGLESHLAAGRVRLVFVIDDAPPELIRLVGYLEAMAEGLTIDLVTVALYRASDAEVLVPSRVEPERVRLDPPPRPPGAASKGTLTEGADAFIASIDAAKPEDRSELSRLADWAVALERDGLARVYSFRGVSGRFTLLPRLAGEDAGMVTIWNDGGPYISLWQTVIERVAPASVGRIEELSGLSPIGQGRTIRTPTPTLMDALTGAYREASEGRAQQRG
jgi:hypothetical protein